MYYHYYLEYRGLPLLSLWYILLTREPQQLFLRVHRNGVTCRVQRNILLMRTPQRSAYTATRAPQRVTPQRADAYAPTAGEADRGGGGRVPRVRGGLEARRPPKGPP